MSDVADTRIAESVAALREFVAEHGSLPTAESFRPNALPGFSLGPGAEIG
jgi:hypothetical protein